MTEINNNRDNLISMMAISEDIYRTNNRIYELLRGLMANPHELTNIKESINNLYEKVTTLKNSDIKTPFVEEENVVVPGPEDMSPKVDIGYKKFLETPLKPEEEPVVEVKKPLRKPPKPPRNTRKNPRRNVPQVDAKMRRQNLQKNAGGRRPNKPLKKRQTPTDLQDQ